MIEYIKAIKSLLYMLIVSLVIFIFSFVIRRYNLNILNISGSISYSIQIHTPSTGFFEFLEIISIGIFCSVFVSLITYIIMYQSKTIELISEFVSLQSDILNDLNIHKLIDTIIPLEYFISYYNQVEDYNNNREQYKINGSENSFYEENNFPNNEKIINWLICNKLSDNRNNALVLLHKDIEKVREQLKNDSLYCQYKMINNINIDRIRYIKKKFHME